MPSCSVSFKLCSLTPRASNIWLFYCWVVRMLRNHKVESEQTHKSYPVLYCLFTVVSLLVSGWFFTRLPRVPPWMYSLGVIQRQRQRLYPDLGFSPFCGFLVSRMCPVTFLASLPALSSLLYHSSQAGCNYFQLEL